MLPIYGHSQSYSNAYVLQNTVIFVTSTVTRDEQRVCRGCALTVSLSLCGHTKPKWKSACGYQ